MVPNLAGTWASGMHLSQKQDRDLRGPSGTQGGKIR